MAQNKYTHRLIDGWRRSRLDEPPYVFAEDAPLVDSANADLFTVENPYRGDSKPPDDILYLGLLPQPYFGNLDTASIFVLMSHPGMNPLDFEVEDKELEYRQALLRGLRQKNSADEYPYVFLNPSFAWHTGYEYWQKRLGATPLAVAKQLRISKHAATRRLAREMACIQLVPYHATHLKMAHDMESLLASMEAAISFVQEVLLPRAQRGEILIVVVQKARYWSLPERDNIVIYGPGEYLGAYLTPKTRGGEAIIRWLASRK
jgi:hypothetical protein